MTRIGRTMLAAMCGLFIVGGSASAQHVGVTHDAPKCLPDRCKSVKLLADIVASDQVDAVIIYFKAQGAAEDYYVYMRQMQDAPGKYWGYIPVAKDDIENVEYRIEAIDASGRRTKTDSFRVKVSNDCEAPELTEEEERIARNLVLGLTKPEQDPIPQGFRCAGIASLINTDGEMTAHEDCRRKIASTGWDGLCLIYWKPSTLAVLGAAGVTAAVPVDDPEIPVSRARP